MANIIKWIKEDNTYYDDIYFHFSIKRNICKWSNNKPNNFKILSTIKWKQNKFIRNVFICCCKETKKKLKSKNELKIKNEIYKLKHIPLLKSNLQKAIRRQLRNIAIKTAVSMILIEDETNKIKQIGLYELLRRLTIIIVEDIILMKYFNTLLWFKILLSKGYILNKYFIDIIMISVAIISTFEFQDKKYLDFLINEDIKIIKIINDPKLNQKQRSYLLSLQFRKSYGGMSGDLHMIDKCTYIWYYRFKNNKPGEMFMYNCFYKHNIIMDILNPKDILKEAYDFHCTDICQRINNILKNDLINEKLIKKLIWNNSSSINERFDINYPRFLNNSKFKNHLYWNSVKKLRDGEVNKLFYKYFG
jgi:hypothetical protein